MPKGRRKMFPTQCKAPNCGRITHEVYCDDHKEMRSVYNEPKRASAARRGYNSRWQRYRKYFLSRYPLCNECGRAGEVVDHVIPHKGDYKVFWDTDNHQTLCIPCHNRKTATEDMGAWDTFEGLQ